MILILVFLPAWLDRTDTSMSAFSNHITTTTAAAAAATTTTSTAAAATTTAITTIL